MRIYLLRHDAGSRFAPVRPVDGGPPLAVFDRGNPLAGEVAAAEGAPVIGWSGWTEGPRPADDAEASLLTWGPRGRGAFDALCLRLAAAGSPVWFRPRAGHVLSDAPSCLRLLRTHAADSLGLAADPVGMIAAEMLPRADDHLRRSMESLGPAPGVRCVFLTNCVRRPDGGLDPAPLHRGEIDPSVILRPWRECFPADLPVVLVDDDDQSQVRLLERT